MNHQEALKELNLSGNPDEKEIKKAFRTLSKTHHPDQGGDETKFKKINEAYQTLTNPQPEPVAFQGGGFGGFGGININDFFQHQGGFGGFQQQFVQQHIMATPEPDIQLQATLTFREAFDGIGYKLHYGRQEACLKCQGAGVKFGNGACTTCNGKGNVQTTSQRGNQRFVMNSACSVCQGSGKILDPCNDCNKTGKQHVEKDMTVKIPPGVPNGATMRLTGAGHFDTTRMNDYTELYLKINVIPDEKLWLEGNDLWTKQKVSLLDALEGCKGTVEGMLGTEEIVVSPGARHKDVISVPNKGVSGKGNFNIQVDIDYGEDKEIKGLIEYLNDRKEAAKSLVMTGKVDEGILDFFMI